MKKKIKEKIHRWLFPTSCEEVMTLRVRNAHLAKTAADLGKVIEELNSKPEVSMADLMRDSLKLITVDFVHQEKGVPNHFLNTPDTTDGKALRDLYIGQLYQIGSLEVWDAMIKNVIDTQGNFTLRIAKDDMEVFSGRMMIAGVSLIRDEVKRGYDEYLERSKPKEDFDPTDHSTEGIQVSEE